MIRLFNVSKRYDDVAAVLAHEIGHVAARDPTRIALQTAGSAGLLGLVLGDFAGGTIAELFIAIVQENKFKRLQAFVLGLDGNLVNADRIG